MTSPDLSWVATLHLIARQPIDTNRGTVRHKDQVQSGIFMSTTRSIKNSPIAIWLGITLFGVCVLLMWLPALNTPFWGDDYVFIRTAHATNLSSAAWWSDFWPTTPLKFWRPLSQEAYWRVIDAVLDDNRFATHVMSLLFHVLASMSVALLTFAMARACRWSKPLLTAALAGIVYGGLGMHMLPVHWAAAANNSLLTIFTTLCLAAWVHADESKGLRRSLLLASIPLWLILALLSKESAVLTVALMVIIGLFTGQRQRRKDALITLLACFAITIVWLIFRARFTADTDAAYSLALGKNTVRNAVAFVAWMSNVPREAIRMATTGQWLLALTWIAATAVPMLVSCAMAFWHGRSRLLARQWLCVVLFAGIAYGPYFLLSWNSYAYYAAIAAILPAIALAYCAIDHPRILIILALLTLSSWVAVEGTRQLDHPGLIGRARWAETMLQDLQHRQVGPSLWVAAPDSHRFYAVGAAGLAWRLKLPISSIHLTKQCPADASHCLKIDEDGRWHLQQGSGKH